MKICQCLKHVYYIYILKIKNKKWKIIYEIFETVKYQNFHISPLTNKNIFRKYKNIPSLFKYPFYAFYS